MTNGNTQAAAYLELVAHQEFLLLQLLHSPENRNYFAAVINSFHTMRHTLDVLLQKLDSKNNECYADFVASRKIEPRELIKVLSVLQNHNAKIFL